MDDPLYSVANARDVPTGAGAGRFELRSAYRAPSISAPVLTCRS